MDLARSAGEGSTLSPVSVWVISRDSNTTPCVLHVTSTWHWLIVIVAVGRRSRSPHQPHFGCFAKSLANMSNKATNHLSKTRSPITVYPLSHVFTNPHLML